MKHVGGIHATKGIEQSSAVIRTSSFELLEVFLIAERDLGLLAREVAKNVLKLSDEAKHRIRESLSKFFLIKLLGNGNREKQGDFFRKVRTT